MPFQIDYLAYMKKFIAFIFVLLSAFTHSQEVDFNIKSQDLSTSETYLVIDKLNVSLLPKVSKAWFIPEKLHLAQDDMLAKQLKDPLNSFIVPVADMLEKGQINYKLIVCRGKSTNVLPKSKDSFGFYQGASSLNIIASIFVDPAKMNTEFLTFYVSALANLMRNSSMYANQTKMTEILKKGFWYPELQTVHFDENDLDSTMRKKDVLLSIMSKARVYKAEDIDQAVLNIGIDDLFADILEIKLKGGKTEVHRFFFSSSKGLVYHEVESTSTRKEKIFTKRDIYNYGKSDINGK